MKFFKTKTCWSNAEMIWLKLAIGSAYLMIGSYFSRFFENYYLVIMIVFSISVIRALFMWLDKMNAATRK